MVTTKVYNHDSVIALFDETGKGILKNGLIEYNFFDQKFAKKRFINIKENILIEDFCTAEADTVYNYFQFNDDFFLRLNEFYRHLEQNVVYPRNALKKGIEWVARVSIIIDSKGSISQIYPISKNDWGFEESLIRTIQLKKQFGFVLYRNKPIKLYLEIPFAFEIAPHK